jgi:Zn-dependent peptidase ImmA (M78 family)
MRPSKNSKLPKSITVMGWKIGIELVDEYSFKKDLYGEYVRDEKKIKISQHTDLETQWQTLAHEVVHVVLHLSGKSESLTEDQEEELVVFLEHNLLPLFQFKPNTK